MSKEVQNLRVLEAEAKNVIFTMQLFQSASKGNAVYNPNQNPRMVPEGWNGAPNATGWDVLGFMLPKAAENGLINSIDKNGNTLLHLCALQGKGDMVDTLLQNMELDKISMANPHGQTAAHLAALRGHTEAFGKIFKIIPQAAMQPNKGDTNCLHLSLSEDSKVSVNPEIAKIIISEFKLVDPDLLFVKSKGKSPLEQAFLQLNQYPELKEVITELLFIMPDEEKFELFNKIQELAEAEQVLKGAVKEAAGLKLLEAIEAKDFREAKVQMTEANNHGALEKVANQALDLCLSNGADDRTVEILLNSLTIDNLLTTSYKGCNALHTAIGHKKYDVALKVINKCTDSSLLFMPDAQGLTPLDVVLSFVSQGQDLPNQREVFNKLLCAMPEGYQTAVEGQQGNLETFKFAALVKAQVENLMGEEGITEEAAAQKVIEEQDQKIATIHSIANLVSQVKDALSAAHEEGGTVDLEGANTTITEGSSEIDLAGDNNSSNDPDLCG